MKYVITEESKKAAKWCLMKLMGTVPAQVINVMKQALDALCVPEPKTMEHVCPTCKHIFPHWYSHKCQKTEA